jgi:PTS system galactitol-specific IIC component
MDVLLRIVQGFLDLGASTMLPLFIMVFGLVFGMKFSKALKSGLLIGIGFHGINLVVGFMISTVMPVIGVFAETGTGYDIVDMGWQTMAAAAWATPFAALVVPLGFLINLLLIYTKATSTLNIDLWNYWHFIFTGALTYVITGSYVWGLIAALLTSIIVLKVGDRIADTWGEYFGVPGTTCTTSIGTLTSMPLAWLANRIVDIIPGLNKIDINPREIRDKYGMIGDPAIQGLLAGAFLALIARQPLGVVLQTGVGISATMILMPRMVGILMEGLTPIARAAKESMQKRLSDRDIHIGMDVALGLGDPAVITSAILMVPITIGLALIIPGNRFFPLGELAAMPYLVVFAALAAKGNLLRTVIGTTFFVAWKIVTYNMGAPFCTKLVEWAGMQTPGLIVGGGLDEVQNVIIILLTKVLGK